ncbi:MAG: hypothetical protein JKY70_18445 [Mucilaginibacter sp.]|nr:hypothetical protein [Mucilaginibacter sp.]
MRYLFTNKPANVIALLSITFGIMALSACSKDDLNKQDDTTFINATINDTAKVFNGNVLTASGNNSTVIQANASDGTKMSITFTGALVAGKTYQGGTDKPIVIYTKQDTTFSNTNNNVITLTVTEADDTRAKGTFSGSLIQDVAGNAKTKTVTNGSFNVKLK